MGKNTISTGCPFLKGRPVSKSFPSSSLCVCFTYCFPFQNLLIYLKFGGALPAQAKDIPFYAASQAGFFLSGAECAAALGAGFHAPFADRRKVTPFASLSKRCDRPRVGRERSERPQPGKRRNRGKIRGGPSWAA